jgi:hypothetical protein
MILVLDETLWAIKLQFDYKMVKHEETTYIESYKWFERVPSVGGRVCGVLMLECPYEVTNLNDFLYSFK